MAAGLAGKGHRGLLVVWSYLPFWVRKAAIRILYPQFPVGAVAVIRDAAGRVLLVRQTYHRREMWGAPGGWVGRGETPRRAAARETFEEVGLRVSVGRILAQDGGPYGEVSLAFECRLADGHAVDYSDEIDRAAYFPPDRLPPLPQETRRLLRDALAALGHPTEEAAPGLPGRR